MKNYIVKFNHEYYPNHCPEDLYLTENGLNEFLKKFEKEFKNTHEKMSFIKKDNEIIIDGDFIIFWEEYKTPKMPEFVDKLPDNIEISCSNDGYDATALCLDLY